MHGRTMQRRPSKISGVVVCFAVAGLGLARLASADEKPRPAAVAPDLSGRWALNKDLSDDARQKVHEQMERRGGSGNPGMGPSRPGMGGGGRMAPPSGLDDGDASHETTQAIFNPAEELTIYQGQPDLVIEEKFARRRTFHADGRKYKGDNGTSEVKTEWKEGRLVIETRGFRGQKTTETWELSATGRRLTSLVKLESGFGGAVTLKRVYDKLDAPPPAAGEADEPAP